MNVNYHRASLFDAVGTSVFVELSKSESIEISQRTKNETRSIAYWFQMHEIAESTTRTITRKKDKYTVELSLRDPMRMTGFDDGSSLLLKGNICSFSARTPFDIDDNKLHENP